MVGRLRSVTIDEGVFEMIFLLALIVRLKMEGEMHVGFVVEDCLRVACLGNDVVCIM